MEKRINIEVKGKSYSIPNAWEELTPEQFIFLAGLLRQYAAGALSVSDVRLQFVVFVLDLDLRYIPKKHVDTIAQNLYLLLSKITFIFNLKYPNDIWKNLTPELRKSALKTEPSDLPDSPEVRLLRRVDYTYVVDACFATQLLPSIEVGKNTLKGYAVNTSCGQLSCSLTARQYVDASECLYGIDKNAELMPLLVATLYQPGEYSSAWAHDNADTFKTVDQSVLEAVALNFQAFVLLLFTKTHFSILWQKGNKKDTQSGKLSVGIKEGVYALSEDGYGDINTVGNMPLIEYLDILRKKKIDAVRTMHSAEIKVTEISEKTGLDIETINKII